LVPIPSKSARQDGCSIYNNNSISSSENTSTESKPHKPKATRLKTGWRLPQDWGIWTLENFYITEDQVRAEAASFRDYWHGRSDRGAAKLDWYATWRNWVRNSRAKYRARKQDKSAAPDLLSAPATDSKQAIIDVNEAIAAAEGWFTPNAEIVRE
jgi:hypothetical protein